MACRLRNGVSTRQSTKSYLFYFQMLVEQSYLRHLSTRGSDFPKVFFSRSIIFRLTGARCANPVRRPLPRTISCISIPKMICDFTDIYTCNCIVRIPKGLYRETFGATQWYKNDARIERLTTHPHVLINVRQFDKSHMTRMNIGTAVSRLRFPSAISRFAQLLRSAVTPDPRVWGDGIRKTIDHNTFRTSRNTW